VARDIDNEGYVVYIYSIHSQYRRNKMPNAGNRSRYFLDIEPELRNRFKAYAALQGKTMKQWLTEAIIAKLEDEIDSVEGLASLAETEGTVSLEAYLESRKDRVGQPE
jgi:predicted HicB family RNase H-like nuclease